MIDYCVGQLNIKASKLIEDTEASTSFLKYPKNSKTPHSFSGSIVNVKRKSASIDFKKNPLLRNIVGTKQIFENYKTELQNKKFRYPRKSIFSDV